MNMDKIKLYHLRICLAWTILVSVFVFVLGLRFENALQSIPWWFSLIFGWSTLVVSLKLGEILYGDNK